MKKEVSTVVEICFITFIVLSTVAMWKSGVVNSSSSVSKIPAFAKNSELWVYIAGEKELPQILDWGSEIKTSLIKKEVSWAVYKLPDENLAVWGIPLFKGKVLCLPQDDRKKIIISLADEYIPPGDLPDY